EKQDKQVEILKEFGLISYTPLRRKYIYTISDLISLQRYIQKNNIDILLSVTDYAGKLSRILFLFNKKIKFYHSHQCIDIYRKRGFNFFFESFVEYLLSNNIDNYISC